MTIHFFSTFLAFFVIWDAPKAFPWYPLFFGDIYSCTPTFPPTCRTQPSPFLAREQMRPASRPTRCGSKSGPRRQQRGRARSASNLQASKGDSPRNLRVWFSEIGSCCTNILDTRVCVVFGDSGLEPLIVKRTPPDRQPGQLPSPGGNSRDYRSWLPFSFTLNRPCPFSSTKTIFMIAFFTDHTLWNLSHPAKKVCDDFNLPSTVFVILNYLGADSEACGVAGPCLLPYSLG